MNLIKYLTAVAGLAVAALPAMAADLTVNVEGIRASDGRLYVSLQTREQFMKNDGTYGVMVDAPAAGSAAPVITGIAPGDYAVSVWHDDNANGTFDMGARGPLDGWAMIGGETMGAPPSFDDAKLTIGESNTSATVTMIYGRDE